jgi:uncharacterized protein (TIGR02145 family)
MKKLFYIATAAILTFSMMACDPEDPEPEPGPGPTPTVVPEGYVDLGLPSGLLWAECNLGATAPEGYGDFYAWGLTTTSSDYSWEEYPYGAPIDESGHNTVYKYNTSELYGPADNLSTLLPEDDAATQLLGDGYRMPTRAEWKELFDNTSVAWTTVNGVNGRRYTGPNGNSIFLPAAGGMFGTGLDGQGDYGRYWSSSVVESDPYYAWGIGFISNHQDEFDGCRGFGRSVRAVRPAGQD